MFGVPCHFEARSLRPKYASDKSTTVNRPHSSRKRLRRYIAWTALALLAIYSFSTALPSRSQWIGQVQEAWPPSLSAHHLLHYGSGLYQSTGIPSTIWQLHLRPADAKPPDATYFDATRSWMTLNPEYEYRMLGAEALEKFILQHYSDHPEILSTWHQLQAGIMKADYGRYLVLAAQGGVYADIDVECRRPVRDWIPHHWQNSTALVLGVEYDKRDGDPWAMPVPLTLSQYIMLAAPRHPILQRAVQDITSNLQSWLQKQRSASNETRPSLDDVVTITGPVAWTVSVFKSLRILTGQRVDWHMLSKLEAPLQLNDVVIHPVNAFGAGQLHSQAGRVDDPEVSAQMLVYHAFEGTWTAQTTGFGQMIYDHSLEDPRPD